VSYATTNGTATVADGDYVSTNGSLSFSAGQLTRTLTVAVNGDNKYESLEVYYVNLSGAVNATIADSQGIGSS